MMGRVCRLLQPGPALPLIIGTLGARGFGIFALQDFLSVRDNHSGGRGFIHKLFLALLQLLQFTREPIDQRRPFGQARAGLKRDRANQSREQFAGESRIG